MTFVIVFLKFKATENNFRHEYSICRISWSITSDFSKGILYTEGLICINSTNCNKDVSVTEDHLKLLGAAIEFSLTGVGVVGIYKQSSELLVCGVLGVAGNEIVMFSKFLIQIARAITIGTIDEDCSEDSTYYDDYCNDL